MQKDVASDHEVSKHFGQNSAGATVIEKVIRRLRELRQLDIDRVLFLAGELRHGGIHVQAEEPDVGREQGHQEPSRQAADAIGADALIGLCRGVVFVLTLKRDQTGDRHARCGASVLQDGRTGSRQRAETRCCGFHAGLFRFRKGFSGERSGRAGQLGQQGHGRISRGRSAASRGRWDRR